MRMRILASTYTCILICIFAPTYICMLTCCRL